MPAGTFKTFKQASKRQRRDASPRLRRQNAILNSQVDLRSKYQELKYFDTTESGALIDNTMEALGFVTSRNLITQGDANTNRDGAVIQVKSFEYKFDLVYSPAASTTGSTTVWLWIVLDRQPNGAAAGMTDIFTTTNGATAMPNVANQYRFKILRKHSIPIVCNAGVQTAFSEGRAGVSDYIKFKTPLEIRFTGNAGTIADVTRNNILIVAGTTGSDDAVAAVGATRVRFTG